MDSLTPSPFENDLMPLIAMIELVFDIILTPFINDEIVKYKEAYLKNPNSVVDLNNKIKESYKRVLELLSKNYVNKLHTFYFSKEGLMLYVVHNLHKLSLERIK
jgi:hypothetical protein